MNDLERDLRTLLDAKSGQAPTVSTPPGGLVRRARTRQVRTALVAGLAAVALVVGSVVGIREFVTTDGTRPADQPTETTTMNGVSITHPTDWVVIDPDEAGLNGAGPETFPRLILALAPFDTGELFGCPGMVEGTMPTFLLTIQEQPLALTGGSAAAWPQELEPLFVEGAGGTGVVETTGGCYPGWEFQRAGWTASGRTFEARVGLAPEITDEDRRELLEAYTSMTFAPAGPGGPVEAILDEGETGGESWQFTALLDGGLQLSIDTDDSSSGTGGFTDAPYELTWAEQPVGDGADERVLVYGVVPGEVVRLETTGDAPESASVLDIPDEIGERFDAFLIVMQTGQTTSVSAVTADGEVVAMAEITSGNRGPVETPLPGEQLYRGRTNDCFWRINANPEAGAPQSLQLVPDDGTGSVTVPLDLGPDAPVLQLALFTCETGGTLAFGAVSPEVHRIRWLPTTGDELIEGVGCIPSDLPDRVCFFLSDHVNLSAGGESVALDPQGNEIGRVAFP